MNALVIAYKLEESIHIYFLTKPLFIVSLLQDLNRDVVEEDALTQSTALEEESAIRSALRDYSFSPGIIIIITINPSNNLLIKKKK